MAYSEVKGVQHEPVGDVDSNGKEAELAHGHHVDEVPDDGEGENVGERSEENLGAAPTESEADTFRYRVMERDGKDRFCLSHQLMIIPRSRPV